MVTDTLLSRAGSLPQKLLPFTNRHFENLIAVKSIFPRMFKDELP